MTLALDGESVGPAILLYVTEECPYCRQEIRRWGEAQVHESEDGPRIFVVSPSPLSTSSRPQSTTFVTDTSGLIGRELGVRAVPSLIVVDVTGSVIEARAGSNDSGSIRALLRGTAFGHEPP